MKTQLSEMLLNLKKDVEHVEIRIFTMDYRTEGFEEGGYVCLQAWMTLKDGKKGKKELMEAEYPTYQEAKTSAIMQMEVFERDLKGQDWIKLTLDIE